MNALLDLPWYLSIPLVWLTARLLLVVPLGLSAPKLDQITRIPFGPSGKIAKTDFGCMMLLISGAFAAMAAAGYLANHFQPAETAVIIMMCGSLGFFALLFGFLFDAWLTDTVQSAVSQSLVRSRLPEVRGWLEDGTDQEKLKAVFVLGYLRTRKVAAEFLPDLHRVLDSPNSEVRFFAISAVMSIVQETHALPPGMRPKLFRLLEDPDPRVRAPAARALVEARIVDLSEVVRPLASALMSDDHSAWSFVTWYLDAPGRYTHLALAEIFEAVVKHGEVCQKAMDLPFRWIHPAGKPALLEALQHPNPHVRKLAARGIEKMEHAHGANPLPEGFQTI